MATSPVPPEFFLLIFPGLAGAIAGLIVGLLIWCVWRAGIFRHLWINITAWALSAIFALNVGLFAIPRWVYRTPRRSIPDSEAVLLSIMLCIAVISAIALMTLLYWITGRRKA